MGQDRLTGLALLHIHDIPIDIDDVIEVCNFASTSYEIDKHFKRIKLIIIFVVVYSYL